MVGRVGTSASVTECDCRLSYEFAVCKEKFKKSSELEKKKLKAMSKYELSLLEGSRLKGLQTASELTTRIARYKWGRIFLLILCFSCPAFSGLCS